VCARLAGCWVFCFSCYHTGSSRPRSQRELGDEVLSEITTRIYTQSRGTYEAPRVHAELRQDHGV
jgi:putative transposase